MQCPVEVVRVISIANLFPKLHCFFESERVLPCVGFALYVDPKFPEEFVEATCIL